MMPSRLTRRSLLAGGTAGLCRARLTDVAAAAATPLNMQLGWLGGGNQLGEACALRLGYFEKEGLDFEIQPGGPNNDGIAVVTSVHYEIGQASSSPSLMLGVSQDLPSS
jgi:NitT/TauT family transport system substrate-binding protein